MRLAWFTPLPPMPSGIADYSTEILPHVAGKAEVVAFCPRGSLLRRVRPPRGVPVRDPGAFDGNDGFDACFYHLGNNPQHRFVYEAARHRPEIAVFHDADLHHLIAHITIEQGGDAGRYGSTLHTEYGQLGTRLATLRRNGIASDLEKFLFPLTKHVAREAKGIVVHNRDAAERMREAAPDVPIEVIPHHAGEPPAEVVGVTREEARRRLGLSAGAFLVAHLGFVTKPKQPAAVVGGFAALHREFPDSVLLVVGADHTGGALPRMVRRLGLDGAVRLTGFVDLTKMYLYLKAADAVINLRYPTAGESSGTLARSLAEGRAVIVNNYASWAELPDDAVLKVEIDGAQTDQVGAHLLRLAGDRAFRAGVEDRARAYARTILDVDRCRDLYLAFAERVGGRELAVEPVPLPRRSNVTVEEAEAELEAIRGRLDELLAETIPEQGTGLLVDALYRLVLRRPAEDDAVRAAETELLTGGKLTRSRLVEHILHSREFGEVRLLEDILQDLEETPRPFSLWPDSPVGPNTTERLVEIPWMLSRWHGERHVLDVGYAFASGVWLTGLARLGIPSLNGVDLAVRPVPGMRRVRADIRRLPYRDGAFGLIYCISTIEHVGRDNTRYGVPLEPIDPEADARSLRELGRVLAPGGRLLVSVPLGRREDHGWFQQYDAESWQDLIRRTSLEVKEQEAFRLTDDGWIRVEDVRSTGLLAYGEGAPAAQGVLCASLVSRG